MKALLAIAGLATLLGCSKDSKNAALNTAPVDQTAKAPDSAAPAADSGGEASTPVESSAPVVSACGTRGGVQCAEGEFCDFGGDVACGGTDKGGRCKAMTQACTRIYMPVCGCDGRNYGNECEAHSHGISVKHECACTPDK